MSSRKTPRKTLAETKAEYRSRGFWEAMRWLEEAWRSKVRLTPGGPRGGEELWEILEKMQAHGGLLDDDYKEIMFPRVYGKKIDRLSKRVILLKPHPHAGRRGFIRGPAERDGLHRVFFLDSRGRVDNAYAKPEHIKELEDG